MRLRLLLMPAATGLFGALMPLLPLPPPLTVENNVGTRGERRFAKVFHIHIHTFVCVVTKWLKVNREKKEEKFSTCENRPYKQGH